MMFLAPGALIGLTLLALPIIIHLFKPRRMRSTPFSSLRWLRQTHQRLSRRIRWHQWLLFAVRAGFIILLVLALARPLLSSRGGGRPTDRIIILDTGRGMTYRLPEQPSSLEKARNLTAQLLQNPRPGDRTALLLANAQPKLIAPLVADASVHAATLQTIHPTEADAHLDATLPLVRSLLPADEGRDVELVFVTDSRTQSWRQGAIQDFLQDAPRSPRIRILDVGEGVARNGWISTAHLLHGEDGPILRVEMGCVGDGPQERTVHVAGVPELAEESQKVTLRPGQASRVSFKLPRSVEQGRPALEVRLEKPDALADDDRFFVNLDTQTALRVLLVEPEKPGRDGAPVGFYLRTGLETLAAADRQALTVVSRTSASVSSGDVEQADLIVLAGVPELLEGAVDALQKRVRSGASLVVFLGDGMRTSFYNQTLHRPLQPTEGLLPLPLADKEAIVRPEQPAALEGFRWSHPLLAPLYDPVLGDLAQTHAQRHATFAGAVGGPDVVLASFSDGAPALIEHPLGAGRVLIFNTSANDSWSDLPRRKSYVPLLDRVVSYLSAGGARRHFTVGAPVTLSLPRYEGEGVTVLAPDGTRHTPQLLQAGGVRLLHLEEAPAAGVYRIELPGGKALSFVANASRAQSRLTPIDDSVLAEWWKPASVETLTPEMLAERQAGQPASWPLWPTLLLLAGVLFVVETLYVTVLCPRVSPTAVGSVVTQRGLLRPLHDPNPSEVTANAGPR